MAKIINPFTVDYAKQELKFFGLKEYNKDGVVIESVELIGRCDDYLNVNFRSGEIKSPRLLIDGTLWMSLTFMELQSHWVPIRKAGGKIATLGLGLGYFTLKAMAKPEVYSIDVYEKEQRIVDYFKEIFSKRKGFNKVKFIVGDARKKMKKKKYDFVFSDIYENILSDEMLSDINLFLDNNSINTYYPWGFCIAVYKYVELGLGRFIDIDIMKLLVQWSESKGASLRSPADHIDSDFIEELVNSVKERKCI